MGTAERLTELERQNRDLKCTLLNMEKMLRTILSQVNGQGYMLSYN